MTNYFTAIILGLVQGFTEFLPVSSSGHLVIAQHIIPGFNAPPVIFDAVLHMGTLFAILFYFKKQILALKFGYIKLLVVASIPAFLFGLLVNNYADRLFESILLVSIGLIITGLFNLKVSNTKSVGTVITSKIALFIGLFQAIAIIPGISRSGSTIFAGVVKGVDKKNAAQFSFLLSIPAVMGANFLQIMKASEYVIDLNFFAVGFILAFLAGILAINLVIRSLESKIYKYFSFYCLALGFIVLMQTLFWG